MNIPVDLVIDGTSSLPRELALLFESEDDDFSFAAMGAAATYLETDGLSSISAI